MSHFENGYIRWLCGMVDYGRTRRTTAGKTMLYLFEREFYIINPRDENRVADVMVLRERYGKLTDNPDFLFQLDKEPTVLEILIVLARAMTFMLSTNDHPYELNCQYFKELVENLTHIRRGDIKESVDRFLDRTYPRNGGIFPLSERTDDQRDEELWYQMMNYIFEHHNPL